MATKINKKINNGINVVVDENEYPEYKMSYEVLALKKEDVYENDEPLERAYLLMSGEVIFECDHEIISVKRPNFYDHDPYLYHLPANEKIKIIGQEETEIAIFKTENNKTFDAKLYTPDDIVIETRGQGTMNEAGTRIVRTIIDHSINEKANLMIGEDMHYPGKWAGFPSHHHPQPEIYYYRFVPTNGFGLLKLGDEGVLIEENDTILIPPNKDHPQVTAPGYAMYFIWTIRHLDDNPYITPTYDQQHEWVEAEDAVYWPNKA